MSARISVHSGTAGSVRSTPSAIVIVPFMQPMIDFYPKIERGSWEHQEYYELLRRGLAYCAGV